MEILEFIAVLHNAERGCRQEYESRKASFVWAKTAEEWKAKADGIRFAIDTAAALLIPAPPPPPPDPRNATCGPCGHFWDWHGKRDDGACKGGYPVGMAVSPCDCRRERPAS